MMLAMEQAVEVATLDENSLDTWQNKWTAIGLSTEPVDRKLAEAAIGSAYRAADLDAPRRIVWCGSPFSLGLTRSIILDEYFLECTAEAVWRNVKSADGTRLKDEIVDGIGGTMRLVDGIQIRKKLQDGVKCAIRETMTTRHLARMNEPAKSSVCASVWDNVWDGIWTSVWDKMWSGIESGIRIALRKQTKRELDNAIMNSLASHVGGSVKQKLWEYPMEKSWADVRDSIGSQARVQVFDRLWSELRVRIWDNVAKPIGERIKATASDSHVASAYGQHDAYWLAYYDYMREARGLGGQTERLRGLLDVAKSVGWFTPHANLCWVSERPNLLRIDKFGRLDAQNGPALSYPDGFSIYARNDASPAQGKL